MLDYIELYNFKCFKELSVRLKALNIITGTNSAGKSSIIQVLLMLRQTYVDKSQDIGLDCNLRLDGDLVNLEDADSIRYLLSEQSDIRFYLEADDVHIDILIPKAINKEKTVPCVLEESVEGCAKVFNIFEENFVYLYADRAEPRARSQKNIFSTVTYSRLGDKSGNNSIAYYWECVSGKRPIALDGLKFSNSVSLERNVAEWMSYIMNSRVHPQVIQVNGGDEVEMSYIHIVDGYEVSVSPLNMGFGNSYIFPIVLGVLTAPKGSLFIVENPEVHLHPKAQFRMGEFLALAAHCGVQVIVESHSDHLINGIRLATKKNRILPEETEILFIYSEKQDMLSHRCLPIDIYEDGRLTSWPEDFFDEWENALIELTKQK